MSELTRAVGTRAEVLRDALQGVAGIKTVLPVGLRSEWFTEPDILDGFPAATFRLFTSDQDSLNVLHEVGRIKYREQVSFQGGHVRLSTFKIALFVEADSPKTYYEVLDPLEVAVRRALKETCRVFRFSEPSEVNLIHFETRKFFERTFLVEVKR